MKSKKNTIQKIKTAELVAKKDLKYIKEGSRNPIFLILDNIRSMYNIGAIFRTADAARIKKIYLCGITATPPRKEIEKTALKTIDYVPWEYSPTATEVVKVLKSKKVNIVAMEQTNRSVNFKEFDFRMPIAIIIGHETIGISEEVLTLCDSSIEIPMYGIANSLNVSVATGIILYHLIDYQK
jgi:tRNA G18 (ribose-2'-O)-methylase SpoU